MHNADMRIGRQRYFRGFESYKDAQTPRDHIVLQDMSLVSNVDSRHAILKEVCNFAHTHLKQLCNYPLPPAPVQQTRMLSLGTLSQWQCHQIKPEHSEHRGYQSPACQPRVIYMICPGDLVLIPPCTQTPQAMRLAQASRSK